DDLPIIVTVKPNQAEKLGEFDVHAAQKRAVATAAVHEVGRHFTAQLYPRLHDEPREPWDAIDLLPFRRKRIHRDNLLAGDSVLLEQEVITPDRGGEQRRFEARFAVA